MTVILQRYNGSEWVTETIGGGGGGSSNHASLTNLSWALAGHTGTALTFAGFDASGEATAYLIADYGKWASAPSGSGVVVTDGSGLLDESAIVSIAEFNYLAAASSNIQTQLDGKPSWKVAVLGGRAVYSDSLGRLLESGVTDTELGYLDGVTSNIQTQLDTKGGKVKTNFIYVKKPSAAGERPVLSVPVDCTITRITHITDTGTVDWNLEERAEATPFASGTNVYAVDEQSSTTHSIDTSFTNASLAAYSTLFYCPSAVASGPNELIIRVTYEED